MKSLNYLIRHIILAAFLGIASVSSAAVIDVYPTGDPAFTATHPFPLFTGLPCTTDVFNTQMALLMAAPGDTVVLHANNMAGEQTPFVFGSPFPAPSCVVVKSLTITGEEGGDPTAGEGMTTITNGAWPFFISQFSSTPSDTDVEISNIHFHNAVYAAIGVFQCRDFAAIGNRITADTMADKLDYVSGYGFGILVQGLDTNSSDLVPDNVHGRVTIQDNYINLEENMPTSPTWSTWSILAMGTVADIDISGNRCLNDTLNGIALVDNSGVMWVENNSVELGVSNPNEFTAHGILVVQSISTSPEPVGNAYISKNTVVCQGPTQLAIELANPVDSAGLGPSSVEKNNLVLNGSLMGIVLAGIDNATVGQNRLKGESGFGILIFGHSDSLYIFGNEDDKPVPPLMFGTAENNVLTGNNISGLEPLAFGVYFDSFAKNNTLVGGKGTLLDLGTDNTVKGGYWDIYTEGHVTTPGGVGQYVSEH